MYRLVQKEGEECKFVAKIDEESSTGTVLAEIWTNIESQPFTFYTMVLFSGMENKWEELDHPLIKK